MREDYNVVIKSKLFEGISEKQVKYLLRCVNSYKKGFRNHEMVVLAGEEVDYIGLVTEGEAEMVKEDLAGNRHLVGILKPSDVFAEDMVCTKERISSYSVQARGELEVLFIPFERIIHTCSRSCLFHVVNGKYFPAKNGNYFPAVFGK